MLGQSHEPAGLALSLMVLITSIADLMLICPSYMKIINYYLKLSMYLLDCMAYVLVQIGHIWLIFTHFKFVGRGSETLLQVSENLKILYLVNWINWI